MSMGECIIDAAALPTTHKLTVEMYGNFVIC